MRFIILTYISFVFSVSSAFSQNATTYQKVDRVFSEWQTDSTPGVAIAIVRNGKVSYQKTYGMADLKKGRPIDSLTKFWIASVTKQFTATAIYLLEGRGRIRPGNSIRLYFPELPLVFEPVTVYQLLHHISGIRDGFVLTALSKKPEDEYTNENVLRYLKRQQELNFKPGTAYEYNNSGYVLLAFLIEKVSGKLYPEFIKENIFAPLGMTDSYVSGRYRQDSLMAEGYHSKDYSNRSGTFEEGHFKGDTYGSTGIITSLKDLTRWTRFVQSPDTPQNLAIAVEKILNPGKLNDGRLIAYGGGLEKFHYGGRTVFEHFGADEGFKANILFFPSVDLSIVGLTNNSTDYQFSNKLYKVADILDNKRAIQKATANSNDSLLWEQSYFDSSRLPAYLHIKMYHSYATISETPAGFAMPYRKYGDSFQTNGPIIQRSFLITKSIVRVQDKYYQQSKSLKAITDRSIYDTAFAGKYYADELEASYDILNDKDGLFLEFVPGLRFKLIQLTKSDFIFDYAGPNYIHFTNSGMEFSREGVHRLKFVKQ